MQIIPGYLIVLTIVLVVLPSVAAIFLRLALYAHLGSQGKQVRRLLHGQSNGKKPRIIEYLEKRFADAVVKLDQVNTGALIDQVYSREKVGFLSCEQIENLCRILPNLLLSFGLLGTFVGITINLWSLSETVSQTNAIDVGGLLRELQTPLQGMGIAFTTSLAAIFFSALLRIVNLLLNTNLAKYRLISAVEDYLDNVYLPTLEGETRLDKIVKGMTTSFDGFLIRFGQAVREAVQSSLQEKLQEIFDANRKAGQLAEQVYARLAQSSSTIAKSADEFQRAADRFTEVAQSFEHSDFPRKLASVTSDLASTQRNFSQSASVLLESVQVIETAVAEMHSYSKNLAKLGEQINSSNQMSGQLLESNQRNQHALGEIIPELREGSSGFQSAVKAFERLQKEAIAREENVLEVQGSLAKLVGNLNSYTEGVNRGIQNLGERFAESLSNQTYNNDAQFKLVVKNLQQCINYLNEAKHEMTRMRQVLEKQKGGDLVDKVRVTNQ